MSGFLNESTLCLVSLAVIPNAGEVFTPEKCIYYLHECFPIFWVPRLYT